MRFFLFVAGLIMRGMSILMAFAVVFMGLVIIDSLLGLSRPAVLIPYLIVGFVIGIPYAEVSTREFRNVDGKWVHDPMEYTAVVAKFSVIWLPWFALIGASKVILGYRRLCRRNRIRDAT